MPSASPPQVAAILDTVGEGVITIDVEQRIRLVNREAERIFGYERDQLLGESVQALIPDEYRGRHEAGFRARLAQAAGPHVFDYKRFEGLRRDGSRFPLELRFTSVRTDEGLFFTAAVRDVTERVEREREIERLTQELARERDYLREEVREIGGFGRIVGESPELKFVLAQVEAVAPTAATVLVQGESGVGKELVARAIHDLSDRRQESLVRVNCASVPESLFESEFFGHRKGAFTGAIADRDGRFLLADGGTLFLDEVGEIPLALQPKLLRVLQEQQFEPVGDDRTRTVDVRVVAATNRDLAREVAEGRFREDLYYRLGVFPLKVPPLRERGRDVLLLAHHFLTKLGREARLSADVERALLAYPWPGNARELQNVVERAAILAGPGELEAWMVTTVGGIAAASAPPPRGVVVDRERITETLKRHGGVVARAARELGLSRQALYRRMERFGIDR